MFKVKRNSKGFTLIELLIVIAIIGILAAIAIPAYTGYTKKSKVSGVVNAMGAVKNAVVAYYTEKGTLNNLTLTDNTQIQSTFGITVPTQYITAINVVNNGDQGVIITATLDNQNIGNLGTGNTLTLTGSNLSGSPTWSWGGTIDDAYKPRGQ